MDVALRAAVVADAPLLAYVGVQSWRETYAGLLSAPLPAQAFYDRLGGRRLPRRPIFEDRGVPVFEVGFRWDRPESLA